jgi:hypothetical protein
MLPWEARTRAIPAPYRWGLVWGKRVRGGRRTVVGPAPMRIARDFGAIVRIVDWIESNMKVRRNMCMKRSKR